jgi:hypothetical protein
MAEGNPMGVPGTGCDFKDRYTSLLLKYHCASAHISKWDRRFFSGMGRRHQSNYD